MSKDVILDKYARLYEMPHQLSLLGHEVECFCLSYQSHAEGIWNESTSLVWYSKSYTGLKKAGLFTYPFFLLRQLQQYQPDIIIAASDIPHIVWGAWLAKKLNKPFIADLYDNFEAYGQAKIPLFRNLFHKALDQACLITTTSQSLAKKIRAEHLGVKHVLPLPSVIDKALFKVGDQQQARQQLNLPLDVPLIGTAGGLTKMKGITDLFQAWEIIKQRDPQVYLVLAGPIEAQTPIPQDERVIYLGLLPHQQVVTLFQALDIGILCIPDDAFGQYCFPQKAYEMLATGLPIVSTAVGDMIELVGENQQLLYNAKNSKQLADCVIKQLQKGQKLHVHIPDWSENIQKMNDYLTL